jgi:hypothetical protein
MALDKKLSRRQLLGAGGAAAAVATLAPFSAAAAFADPAAGQGAGRLIPEEKVGTITFTQRDVPGRMGISTGNPTMGYLGGPNFPEDPTDLGPLVPLPGGWRELFGYLAMVGFEQIEFAGYGQNAANPRRACPQPGSRRCDDPGVARCLSRLRPHSAGLPRRVRPRGDR